MKPGKQSKTPDGARNLPDDSHRFEEYRTLRAEIANNSTVVAQVFSITFPAAAALIGYGIDKENWLVLLSPYAILLPSLWFVSSQVESTVRISTYIRLFIESRCAGLRWEHRLLQVRNRAQMHVSDRSYIKSITGLYGGVCAVCTALSGAYYSQMLHRVPFTEAGRMGYDAVWVTINATVLGLAYLVLKGAANALSSKRFAEYEKQWQQTTQ